MEFYFYSISDESRESICKKKFNSYEEALNYFSTLKQLTVSEFLKLFQIFPNE